MSHTWVAMKTAVPSFLSFSNNAPMAQAATGSMPWKGSSATRSRGQASRASATHRRRSSSGESFSTLSSSLSAIPAKAADALTFSFMSPAFPPWIWAKYAMFSRTVMPDKCTRFWGTKPISRSVFPDFISFPPCRIWPLSFWARPARQRNTVDFPDSPGPNRVVISPGFTVNDTFFTAFFFRKPLVNPVIFKKSIF